jgi:hypothetical protein
MTNSNTMEHSPLEKLVVAQSDKKFSLLYGTQMFSTSHFVCWRYTDSCIYIFCSLQGYEIFRHLEDFQVCACKDVRAHSDPLFPCCECWLYYLALLYPRITISHQTEQLGVAVALGRCLPRLMFFVILVSTSRSMSGQDIISRPLPSDSLFTIPTPLNAI